MNTKRLCIMCHSAQVLIFCQKKNFVAADADAGDDASHHPVSINPKKSCLTLHYLCYAFT